MWQQTYTPIANSLALSALVAAVPIFVLLFMIGIRRKPAWIASLSGLAATVILAAVVYGMPAGMLFSSVLFGAAFGLFPIGWVVFSAILLYRVMQESGKFNTLKDSIGHLTDDGRLQMMRVAFGWSGLRAVLPAAAVCGIAFGGTQFLVSNFIGPELTDILASMAAMGGLFVLVKFWKPRDRFDFGHLPPSKVIHKGRDLAVAWAPYMILVVLVLLWGYPPVKARLDSFTIPINWPGLHNLIQRMPPVVAQPSNY